MTKRNPRNWRKISPTGVYEKHVFCSVETEELIRKMFIEQLYKAKDIASMLNFPSEKSVLAILLRLGATHKSLNRDFKDIFFIRSRHDEYLKLCEKIGYEDAYKYFCELKKEVALEVGKKAAQKEAEKQIKIDRIIADKTISRDVKILKLRDLNVILKDIGKIYNISRERVRQIEERQRNPKPPKKNKKSNMSKQEAVIKQYSLSKSMKETLMGKITYNKINGKIKSLAYLKSKGLCDMDSDEIKLTSLGAQVKSILKQEDQLTPIDEG